MVRVRSSSTQLPAYVPGRKLPGVADRLTELAGGVSRYPDMGAGSSEVCGRLLHSVVGPGDEVVVGRRSFEAYPILTAVAGGTAVRVPLRDHALDLDAMAAAITGRTRLVFVRNPNDPTSTAVGERALGEFADRVPDDLAGLRVGYCVAPPELAAQVRKTQMPFSVSALAQEAAVVALGERGEVVRRSALTVAERERVTLRLRALGFEVPDSQADFVWLPLAEESADFAVHCLDGKVVVRPFPGEGVRVTIGLPEENDALLALAAAWRG
ncbi:aminotransferase class I/II-fold pyridoxal phosphate-dependent enzyme [Streptomyces sp. NBC_01604]|uniref:aminotransferase class I/II-fold pyridoxal phosphate-dependent enzyme n=1 Tax=Streptomyces sp. NBC_01604 TaxID=2975894 RepID=UPI00386E1121